MFEKKKQSTTPKAQGKSSVKTPAPKQTKQAVQLSPKVAEADKLRRAAIKAANTATNIKKQSQEELKNAITKEEKNAIRKKYTDKRKESKMKSDKAFMEYDNYLQKEFGISNPYIATNEAYTGTEKGFINWLQAKFSKQTTKKK